jgi:MFS family permease
MGLLTIVEDRPTPKAVYNWRVYTAACIASWAACMIGYDSAFIGTTLALPSFVEEFRFAEMDPAELNLTKANIVSVYQAGAFFGAFGAYASSHYIGRRKSLILWVLIVSHPSTLQIYWSKC